MLLKASKFFLYASVFAVLVVMTSTFFPFIGGKDYFFRFSVELALIFFVLWWAFEAREGEARALFARVFASPIFVAVSLFVLIFLLATVFAHDPRSAFWSNYERGEGGFQMIHYYLFFALLALLFRKEEDWRWLFRASVVAAVLMILYGVFANLGWADNFISPYQGGGAPDGLWRRLTEARFQGSLGNPAYTAPYLLFSLFYLAYLWAGSRIKNKLLVHVGYGFLAVAFLFFFMLSQTRGALLGLGAAIFVFLLYLAFRAAPRLKTWLVLLLVVFSILGGALVYYRNSSFVKGLPGGRIFDIAFSDQTVNTRLWTWGSAWSGFKERPLLGWGAENFSAVFDKYFDTRHFVPGKNTETWFDRAHSLYFDALAETGILGFVSYFGIFAMIFWRFFKKRKVEFNTDAAPSANKLGARGETFGAVAQMALILALALGYLVQGLAIFDVLPMYINIFLFFAFCNYYFVPSLPAVTGPGNRLAQK